MSKIIFLGIPAHGHVNPTLPVVRELISRGEDIHYYNTEEFQPQIELMGATFGAYPQTGLTSQTIADGLKDGNIANATVLMLHTTEQLLPFILEELQRQKPDLVIFDSLAMWGKMATTLLNLRAAVSITHFIFDLKTGRINFLETLFIIRQSLRQVPRIFTSRSRLVRRYGKAAFPPSNPLFPMRDKLNIVFTARELQPEMSLLDDTFRFVGPSIPVGSKETDPSFGARDNLPLIYISLGTIHSTHIEFYRHCFEAFGGYPAHFILSVGKHTNIESLGSIPLNFLVRNIVPQLEVLQQAKVFVTHGGMNSIHEGLYYGVPLIVIPHQIEQLLNARCVEARGAAYIIKNQVMGKPIRLAELQYALDTVMSQPRYQQSAREIQRTLQATGGYSQAADEIQSYLADGEDHQRLKETLVPTPSLPPT